jgi:hypothetical protein
MVFLKFENLKKVFLAAAFMVTFSVHALETSSQIEKFDLKNCNPKGLCIQLRADKAESGNITPLMSLSNVHIELTEKGRSKKYEASFGYLDLRRQTVVLRLNTALEVMVNLTDLSVKEYKL